MVSMAEPVPLDKMVLMAALVPLDDRVSMVLMDVLEPLVLQEGLELQEHAVLMVPTAKMVSFSFWAPLWILSQASDATCFAVLNANNLTRKVIFKVFFRPCDPFHIA